MRRSMAPPLHAPPCPAVLTPLTTRLSRIGAFGRSRVGGSQFPGPAVVESHSPSHCHPDPTFSAVTRHQE
jgi:hypothetical protein